MLNFYLVSVSTVPTHSMTIIYAVKGTKPEELVFKFDARVDDTVAMVYETLKQVKETCTLNLRKDFPFLAQVKGAIADLNGEGHNCIMETYAEDAFDERTPWIRR